MLESARMIGSGQVEQQEEGGISRPPLGEPARRLLFSCTPAAQQSILDEHLPLQAFHLLNDQICKVTRLNCLRVELLVSEQACGRR